MQGKELTTRRLEPQLLEKEHCRVAFVKYYCTIFFSARKDPVVHRILTVHLGGGVIPVGPLDKLLWNGGNETKCFLDLKSYCQKPICEPDQTRILLYVPVGQRLSWPKPKRTWFQTFNGCLTSYWVYTFNGETEYSTNLRPRGSPTSQLRRGVSFRSREMRPIFAISQRMRSIKESKEVLDTESRSRL
ncbi:putative protein [Arabidopsis thaliana]|uniref:Uncharacterized protein AT4g23760 n=1 Tax=Arabidopsis thaliana TaxID=3702 RepID=Q9SUQ1_ARATH|nr:putative protein [Arabidopsis thaliana]CAB81294.1 putative protein [Arabidopsis thaliana]